MIFDEQHRHARGPASRAAALLENLDKDAAARAVRPARRGIAAVARAAATGHVGGGGDTVAVRILYSERGRRLGARVSQRRLGAQSVGAVQTNQT